jgi:hypothetical protein
LKRTDGEEVCDVAYLCGCDGVRSTVRRGLDLDFPGGTYEQVFYVADVSARGKVANGGFNLCVNAWDFCALMPVRSSGMVRLVGIIPEELKSERDVSFDALQPHVERITGIAIDQVNWFSTYHVHHRVASSFRRGRAFILGDAGHVHSPAGGQGMNTGIGDAVNLSWKLAHVLQERAAPAILDTYESERIAFARTLVATTDRAFQVMVRRGLVGRFYRTFVMARFLPLSLRFRASRRNAFKRLSQIRIHYRTSALSAGKAGAVHGGDRLPWVAFEGADNFAPLKSLDWQLHVYGEARPGTREACREHGLPLHVFPFTPACGQVGLKRDAAYLIRPDGHVGLANAGQEREALQAYLVAQGIWSRPGDKITSEASLASGARPGAA